MPHRAIVTGASGFIGGALVTRLREAGWEVTGVGRRELNEPGCLSHDLACPLPASLDGQYDAVVHAAARSSPWGRRREFERDNVLATRKVVEFCRRNGSPRLVYVSSASVYYRPGHQLGMTEATPLPRRSVNHYAATKRAAEAVVRGYGRSWAILRPRAVYGPGDTVLLPRIVKAARAGRLPLIVPRGGPVVGDLIYVENLVDHLERAASDASVQGDSNLTDNQPVPIYEFLLGVFERLGIAAPTRRVSVRSAMLGAHALELGHRLFAPGREPAITRFGVHVFAYSKTFDVQKMLGVFGPPRVPLEEGVERTVRWLVDQGGA